MTALQPMKHFDVTQVERMGQLGRKLGTQQRYEGALAKAANSIQNSGDYRAGVLEVLASGNLPGAKALANLEYMDTTNAHKGVLFRSQENFRRMKLEADQRERAIDNERADKRLAHDMDNAAFSRQHKLNQLENSKLPPIAKEYQFAKLNGYQGNFEQYQTARAKAKANAKPNLPNVDGEQKLRKEVKTLTTDYRKLRGAFDRVQQSAANPSPAGDMSLIFQYMRLLDPASTVREGEFQLARNAKPALERMGLSWDSVERVWSGQLLSPAQRADFVSRAENLFRNADSRYQSLVKKYKDIANSSNLRPENVIINEGEFSKGPGNMSKTPTGIKFRFLD